MNLGVLVLCWVFVAAAIAIFGLPWGLVAALPGVILLYHESNRSRQHHR